MRPFHLNTLNIIIQKIIDLINIIIQKIIDLKTPKTQIGFGMLVQRRHSSNFTNNGWGEDDVPACVFRALNILNEYV